VLDRRLVEQILHLLGVAKRRIEQLLLELRMDFERLADRFDDLFLRLRVRVLLAVLVFVEQFLDFVVIRLQQVERVYAFLPALE
jgi:hypothetical protein